MKTRLEEGDIVIVNTVLTGESEYPVTRVEGNKAFTGFRTFNRKIHLGRNVYEFGKRYDPCWTANSYRIKTCDKD